MSAHDAAHDTAARGSSQSAAAPGSPGGSHGESGASLFEPLAIAGLTVRNRIMMSPMSQRAAGRDGVATDWHLVHYGSRAIGGCGLVMIEDTAVAALGRTSRAALGLYEEAQALQLRRIVSFCREQGAAVGVQLAHAGRKALADTRGAPGTLSASPVAFGPGWQAPSEAGAGELEGIVAAFAAAAERARLAGVDVLEIHAAHGYLLHQFLSPLTNLREDAYGGRASGRRWLLVEVLAAVRERWPAGSPLFVRLPAGDGDPAGLSSDELLACVRACASAGADLIDLTGGTPLLGGEPVSSERSWELAATLGCECGLPLALGGGILGGADAQALLERHGATLVSVGRPLLEDPYWPLRAARELEARPPLPAVYAAALRSR